MHQFIWVNSRQHFSLEIIICNCAFSEDPQFIFHAIPFLVVETTCALQVFPLFLKLVCLILDSYMGFLEAVHIFFHFQDCFMFVFQ
jgi:hypothetical protein